MEICEKRDIKGLYKLAKEGIIKQFTGISDPFETPTKADIIVDGNNNIDEILNSILVKLEEYHYINLILNI